MSEGMATAANNSTALQTNNELIQVWSNSVGRVMHVENAREELRACKPKRVMTGDIQEEGSLLKNMKRRKHPDQLSASRCTKVLKNSRCQVLYKSVQLC